MNRMTTDEYKATKIASAAKYRNKPTTRTLPNGKTIRFDSQKEAARYDELMLMQKAGNISDLKLQPQYTLIEGYMSCVGERIKPLKYIGDFSYRCGGETVVEDCKGGDATKTQTYRIKKKLMLDRYGISITEI